MTEPLPPLVFEGYTFKPPEVEMVLFQGHEDVERFTAWLTDNLPEGSYVSGSYNAIWFGHIGDERYLYKDGYLCRNADGDIFVINPETKRSIYKPVVAPAPE